MITLSPEHGGLSLRKLRQDTEGLRTVDVTAPTQADLERFERISIPIAVFPGGPFGPLSFLQECVNRL